MNFYTYLHRRSDTNAIFYVGKGTGANKRAFSRKNRNRHWHNIVNKHGYSVEIVAHWHSEQEAFEHEKFLIECFFSLGYSLVNMTAGGDGVSGTAEVKSKIGSKTSERFKDPDFRKRHSEALRRAKASPEFRKLRSELTKKQISNSDHQKKMVELAKIALQDPELKARVFAARNAGQKTPEARARKSVKSTEYWSDGKNRERQSKAILGRKWATDGETAIRLPTGSSLPEGFSFGRPKRSVDAHSR